MVVGAAVDVEFLEGAADVSPSSERRRDGVSEAARTNEKRPRRCELLTASAISTKHQRKEHAMVGPDGYLRLPAPARRSRELAIRNHGAAFPQPHIADGMERL